MRQRLAKKILRGVGIGGLAILSMTSPYFGINLVGGFKRHNDKKSWRKFYLSLNYLNRRGYIRIIGRSDKGITVKVTKEGKDIVKDVDIDSLELKRRGSWDGKWRLVIFDIPVNKNKNRLAFTDRIKKLGFVMIQKSVWAYPFECYEELMILRKFYGIEKYVTYCKAIEIEDELSWRKKFNLRGEKINVE